MLQLKAVICKKLATSVEEIPYEAAVDRIEAKFASMWRDLVFSGLRGLLWPSVYGALIRRTNAHVGDLVKIVPLVGCRKDKSGDRKHSRTRFCEVNSKI